LWERAAVLSVAQPNRASAPAVAAGNQVHAPAAALHPAEFALHTGFPQLMVLPSQQLQAGERPALAQGGFALHLRGGGNPRLLLGVGQLVVCGRLGGQALPGDLLSCGAGVAWSRQGSPDQAIAARPGDCEPQLSDLGYVFDFHLFVSFCCC
jgi:hypothetical protein